MSKGKTQVFDFALSRLQQLFPNIDLEPLYGVGQIRIRVGDEAMWFLPVRKQARSKKQPWRDCDLGILTDLINKMISRQNANLK